MQFKIDVEDLITFHQTGEWDGDHFGSVAHPVISVHFLGVEVERAPFPHWGTEDQHIDTQKYLDHADAMVRKLWSTKEAAR
jgi:hypothetical protein